MEAMDPEATAEEGRSRTASSPQKQAKHMASLQLLYTVGDNQAKLDARTEFRYLAVLAKGEVKRSCTKPYTR